MKTMKYLWMVLLTLMSAGFVACSEEDGDSYPSGNGPVSVSKVFLEDADGTVAEREVTFARLGQTLRLEGTGFGGTRHLYVNGYEVYFNPALVTDRTMLVQLFGSIPVSDADPELRDKIIFEKDGGVRYEYPFLIRSAAPVITSFSNTLPQAGEMVVAYGANLNETAQVILPGGVTIEGDAITNAPASEAGEWFSFVMPAGLTEGGSVTAVGANGTAISPEFFNFQQVILLDFDGHGVFASWSWDENGSMIDGDHDLVQDPLNSGRGRVCQLIPERMMEAGVAAGKMRASEVWNAGGDDPQDDWTQFANIFPLETSVKEIAFQFDIYVPEEWSNTGYIQVNLANNSSFTGYGSSETTSNGVAFFIPWIKEGAVVPFKTNGWQTVTIPLSDFGRWAELIRNEKNPTFGDVAEYRAGTDYHNIGLAFVNGDLTYGGIDYPASVSRQKIYVDNFRLVPCKTFTVSDFPEDESANEEATGDE